MRTQFGRSMIEMLGVLAIIGVLSIGGIMGYRLAMNKYQANTILEDVNRFAFTIIERAGMPEGDISKGDFVQTSSFEILGTNDPNMQSFYIDVINVPKGVCEELLNKKTNEFEIYAGTHLYQGDDDICSGTNLMTFVFGNTDGLCKRLPEEGEEECARGCACDGVCLTDVKTDRKVCCNNNTQKACNDVCYDECNELSYFDTNSCSCKCFPIANCADDGYDENCQCIKCTGEYTASDGICKTVTCSGGTEGNNYYKCNIGGIGCGVNCDSAGHNCGAGVCFTQDCPEGELLVRKTKWDNGAYNYACQHKVKDDYICYRWWEKNVSVNSDRPYSCYKDNELCCNTSDSSTFKCSSGLCGDSKRCTDLKSNATLVNDYCVFPDKLECNYSNGSWVCYKYGYYCGNCTDTQIQNDQCCTGTSCRVSKDYVGSYNAGRCVYTAGGETISCTTTELSNMTHKIQYCYVGNVKRCAIYVSSYFLTFGRINYSGGRCSAVEANCPEGTEYDLVNGYYDCKNKASDGPICRYNDNTISCSYDGQKCGEYCDYFGHNCGRVYLPQCTAAEN